MGVGVKRKTVCTSVVVLLRAGRRQGGRRGWRWCW